MDNEQKKVNQIRPAVDQSGVATWNYLTSGTASGNYNLTTNEAIPPSSHAPVYQMLPPHGYLEEIRAIVREELQRMVSRGSLSDRRRGSQ